MKLVSKGLAAIAATMLFASASAAVITTATANNTGFAVSTTDLISSLVGTVSAGNLNSEEGLNSNTSGSALTDGGFGKLTIDDGSPKSNPGMSIVHEGTTITYTLGNLAGGYNIGRIDTFTGWRDSGRANQNYTVSFAHASDPSNFITAFSVSASDAGFNDLMVSTTGTGGSALDFGVTAVRFNFSGVQNRFVGYREIDVVAVPEPTTLALLGLGMLGFAVSRRKSAK